MIAHPYHPGKTTTARVAAGPRPNHASIRGEAALPGTRPSAVERPEAQGVEGIANDLEVHLRVRRRQTRAMIMLTENERGARMAVDVLVTRHTPNQFSARALALPEVVATGASEAEAIAQLRVALAELRQHSRIVQVDLPLPEARSSHPWQPFAGIWADDPDWQAFEQAVSDARQESRS